MLELISIDLVCILFARSSKNAGQEAAITKPWQTRPAFVTHNSDFHVPNTIAATELSLLQKKTNTTLQQIKSKANKQGYHTLQRRQEVRNNRVVEREASNKS